MEITGDIKHFPHQPTFYVYALLLNGRVEYIGATRSLETRAAQHQKNGWPESTVMRVLHKVPTALETRRLETHEINLHALAHPWLKNVQMRSFFKLPPHERGQDSTFPISGIKVEIRKRGREGWRLKGEMLVTDPDQKEFVYHRLVYKLHRSSCARYRYIYENEPQRRAGLPLPQDKWHAQRQKARAMQEYRMFPQKFRNMDEPASALENTMADPAFQ